MSAAPISLLFANLWYLVHTLAKTKARKTHSILSMLGRFSGQTLRALKLDGRQTYRLLFAGFVTRMGDGASAEEGDAWGDGWG